MNVIVAGCLQRSLPGTAVKREIRRHEYILKKVRPSNAILRDFGPHISFSHNENLESFIPKLISENIFQLK